MTVVEKAAYLKGLVDGVGIDAASAEGKLWTALCDLVSDMAHEIEDLQLSDLDMADAMDEMSEDLSFIEEEMCHFGPEGFLPSAFDEDFCPGECDTCDKDCPLRDEGEPEDGIYRFSSFAASDEEEEDKEDEDEEDEELVYDGIIYDVTCPVCGEEISFDEDTLKEGSIKCPVCGELLEFETDEDK